MKSKKTRILCGCAGLALVLAAFLSYNVTRAEDQKTTTKIIQIGNEKGDSEEVEYHATFEVADASFPETSDTK